MPVCGKWMVCWRPADAALVFALCIVSLPWAQLTACHAAAAAGACRWGFWKRLGTQKDCALLPEGHSPSSPASQHTLIIQEPPGKPLEGSSPSKQFGSGLNSAFASPTAQQQQQQRLGISRLNSELMSRKGSAAVQRRSTDAGGAAGSTRAAAAPAAGSAAAVTSDPLLQPGVLEAVNLRVDGKAVSGGSTCGQDGLCTLSRLLLWSLLAVPRMRHGVLPLLAPSCTNLQTGGAVAAVCWRGSKVTTGLQQQVSL